MKLTRLLNTDGETVGYFSDHVAEQAARREWSTYAEESCDCGGSGSHRCRSIETDITVAELGDVDAGDGDRTDYFYESTKHPLAQAHMRQRMDAKIDLWLDCGAASVSVERHLVNRYRRPGHSNRDADLGGPTEAAGVLYILRVKAPK